MQSSNQALIIWIEFCMTSCSVRQRSALKFCCFDAPKWRPHSPEQLAYSESAGSPRRNQDTLLRRLKIEQSHHYFPQHRKLRHLPIKPMYQEADHRRTTRCCTYHPQVPSRHAFWMLIYLFLVCICQHFGDKCRMVDMAYQF